MKGEIEWKVGEVRIGEEGFCFGDPYVWSCGVMRDGDTAIISRAESFKPEIGKELKRILREAGFTSLAFDRYKRGKKRRITVSLYRSVE